MTTATARDRIGTQSVHDPKTNLSLTLPEDYMIHHRHERVWVGGSDTQNAFLLIERIPADNPAPTLLADGDLDIFMATTGPQENGLGHPMGGTIRGHDVTGYLYRASYNERYSYLVFIATLENQYHGGIAGTCLKIGEMTSGQAAQSAA